MMTRIRMRIASILRRVANRLDPYAPESLSFVAPKYALRPLRGGGPVQDDPPPPPPAGAN
ncbi:MAG: hypothetical protein ACK5YB_05430 [Burkholderiales bacterium]|jgi:hypothetical protein